ncbi:MAG: MFS transporter, partial [Pseudomonadota bacterium]
MRKRFAAFTLQPIARFRPASNCKIGRAMVRQLVPFLSLFGGMIFLMMGGGLHAVIIPVRGDL